MRENILDEILPVVTEVNRWKRLQSLVLEHLLVCLIMVIVSIPILPVIGLIEYYTSHGCLFVYMVLFFILMLNKDMLNGMSLAKRKLGLQIIDIKTNQKAGVLQCALRNSLSIIWPLEVLVLLFTPDRKLGDRIARTKMVLHPTITWAETRAELKAIDKKQLLKDFIIVFVISFGSVYLLAFTVPSSETHLLLKR